MNTEEKIVQIAIEDIIPNRFQPRLSFDEQGLKELSESIKQHGIIQPLVLRRLKDKYEIIAGERRYKASVMAGLKTVPAIISNIDDNKSAEIALVENIQRRNLTPIEEAKSYRSLLDRGYMTQEQLAEKMGVSQSTIANKLRLLNLSDEVQNALLEEKISERHARSLLAIPKEEQASWLKKIISKRLTVRQLDLEIKKAKGDVVEEVPFVSPPSEKKPMINEKEEKNEIQEKKPETILKEPQEPTIKEQPTEKKESSSKFFNFLEDEAANMMMDMPFASSNQDTKIEFPEEIELLDDFELNMPKSEIPLPKEENVEPSSPIKDQVMPYFFENNTPTENKIEEKTPQQEESIINPMDSVIKLDPNYEKIMEEKVGLDLKTAINEVRDLVENLKQKGFSITLEEADLSGTYQMIVNIKEND